MDFSFSAEQEELRHALRDLAADRATSADLRAAMASEAGYDAGLWQVVAELGLPGIAVPESCGGAGGSFVDAAVVFEESGRALLPVPLLGTVVAAAVLASVTEAAQAGQGTGRAGTGPAGGAEAPEAVLPSVAAGERVAVLAVAEPGAVAEAGAVADAEAGERRTDGPRTDEPRTDERLTGELRQVPDGHLAHLFVVAAPQGLWLLRAAAEGVSVSPRAALDPTRRQASVFLDAAPARRIGDAASAARAVDLLRVALAVEAIGVARRCLEMTVDYLKTRVQFDRPIGSFQALQHRAADLVVELESAASAAYYAAWAAADAPDELPVVAPLAKAVCTDAAYRIAAETIQMHGGIGFTWEHDAHLYFKRATTTRLLLGDGHVQRGLVAARSGLLGATGM